MTGAEMLILAATVLAIDADAARLDRGLVEGLLPGDTGSAYYELTVNGKVSRIEAGSVRIREVSPRESLVASIAEEELRPGYRVEFRIPAARTRPRTLLEAARSHLDDRQRVEVSRALVAMVLEDEVFEAALAEELEARRPGSARSASSVPRPHDEVLVPAATYQIGLDHPDAEYRNQQPRHPVELRSFRIDRSPVKLEEVEEFVAARDGAGGVRRVSRVSWNLASDFCRSRGQRLPSEAEWETALRLPTMERGELLEWTSSWYLAYPGGGEREAAYGRKFRVLRGSFPGEEFDPYQRRFDDPDARDPRYGFRCAATVAR